jgi:hypothetical protein
VVNAECEKPSNKVMFYSKKRVKKYKYHGFFCYYTASFLSSLPVSLDCHFLIAPSVFSIVYLEKMTVSVLVSVYFCESELMQKMKNQVIKLCFIAKSVNKNINIMFFLLLYKIVLMNYEHIF